MTFLQRPSRMLNLNAFFCNTFCWMVIIIQYSGYHVVIYIYLFEYLSASVSHYKTHKGREGDEFVDVLSVVLAWNGCSIDMCVVNGVSWVFVWFHCFVFFGIYFYFMSCLSKNKFCQHYNNPQLFPLFLVHEAKKLENIAA